MIARTLEEQLFRWLRAAELTCDRAALLVAQDPKVCYYADTCKLVIIVYWLKYWIINFSFPNPTRGRHLCPHEISWGMSIYGWSTKCGRIPGASSLLWKSCFQPNWVVYKVCMFRALENYVGISFHSESNFWLLIRNAQTRQLSHPLPVLRASEIDEWSKTPAYKSLLKRGIQIKAIEQSV